MTIIYKKSDSPISASFFKKGRLLDMAITPHAIGRKHQTVQAVRYDQRNGAGEVLRTPGVPPIEAAVKGLSE